MSRIHLRSNTLVLWLSLSAAVAASAVSVGCSSSTDSGGASAGSSSGGDTGKAGSGSVAGEPGVGGEPGDGTDNGEGGSEDTPEPETGGTGGMSGSVAGGPSQGGDAGEPGEVGAAGSGDAPDPEVVAAQGRATALIASLGKERTCTYCHDVSYSGGGFYRNITPDVATGIGSWTADEIKAAIRDGKDKDGKTLCKTMERFPFTDDEVSDIVVFLQHLKPISKKTTATCK